MAKKTEENESQELVSPEELLGDFLKKNEERHLNSLPVQEYKISTGSLVLDLATGGGLGPGVHRLVGQNNCGKTPESLEIMRNFLKTVPKSRGFFVDAEGKLNKETKERTDLKFVYTSKEWVDGTVFVFICNEYETVAEIIETLVLRNRESSTKYCFIFDSVDAMVLKADLDKSLTDSIKMAGAPLLSKRFLSRNSIHFSHRGCLCILISQVSADIQADKYNKTTNYGNNYVGGNALQHYPIFIIEYNNVVGHGKYILDDEKGKLNDGITKQLGVNCKVTIRKTSRENKDKNYIYPVKFGIKGGSAIWPERELQMLLIGHGYLKREGQGSFITHPSLLKEVKDNNLEMNEKFRSLKSIFEALEANPKLTSFLHKKLKEELVDVDLSEKEENNEVA